MSEKDEIRKASRHFYAALNRMANGDAGPMADVWSHGPEVTAMHPIGGREIGWDEVRRSFEQVARVAPDGEIELREQFIHVAGELAYELGVERGTVKLGGQEVAIEHRVTNIYRHEDRAWRIVHHHTDTSRPMLDTLDQL